MNSIGIRHEDKYKLERRCPIVPADIKELSEGHDIPFFIEASEKRIFKDEEFEEVGAKVVSSLDDCDVIMGVKEMPVDYFKEGKCYVFFSHVIKAQPYNMPMLKNLLASGATLIDYEKVADEYGRRLIFFGRYAGLAGMINTLWSMGQRYKTMGIENPFSSIKQSYEYDSLKEAQDAISSVGDSIKRNGLPEQLPGIVMAVTGDGNVSNGALEIAKLLPVINISARELTALSKAKKDPNTLYLVNITAADYMHHKQDKPFDLQDYIAHPENYDNHFETLLPFINVLVNGIYWDERYPRLVTKKWLGENFKESFFQLDVIGDITCDPLGSIECTLEATTIEEPVFIYQTDSETHKMGFDGQGVCVMAVDILPSELPREASEHFSSALKPYMKQLAETDFSKPFEELNLPDVFKRAVISHQGKLTPDYAYLEEAVG